MTLFLKTSNHFIKVLKLPPSTYFYGAREKSKYQNNSVTIFSLPFSDSGVFNFFMFCISSIKLNCISCDICLSFKSRHLELFCKIIIQLSSTGIFLEVIIKSSTLQLYWKTFFFFFFAQLWMAACNHLINKCNQKIRQVKNQIIKH